MLKYKEMKIALRPRINIVQELHASGIFNNNPAYIVAPNISFTVRLSPSRAMWLTLAQGPQNPR
jgi:hypothetical protein